MATMAMSDAGARSVAAAVALAEVSREGRAALLRPRLDAARATLAALFHAGGAGDVITRTFSHDVDAIVRDLFRAARSPRTPPIALVAVGGYGRAELCPA